MLPKQISVAIFVIPFLLTPRAGLGQSAPAPTLNVAISQVRDGAFLDALLTLNDLADQLSGQAAAATRAQVHAYRAFVFLRLDQPGAARLAVLDALHANAAVAVEPVEFGATLVALFVEARQDPQRFAGVAVPAPPAPVASPRAAIAPSAGAASSRGAAVYVYWPGQVLVGGNQKVLCNAQQVAELHEGRYITLKVAPGTPRVDVGGARWSATVEDGREYYLRASLQYRAMLPARLILRLIDSAEAAAEMNEKNLLPLEAERTLSTECTRPTAAPGRPGN